MRVGAICERELADEPGFDAVESELTRRLRGVEGEQGRAGRAQRRQRHRVLRREYKLLDQVLPDLPVLGTRYLPKAVGVRPAGAWLTCSPSSA